MSIRHRRTVWILFSAVFFCVHLQPVFGQSAAPGGPGADAQWATAGKQGVGTANNPDSKVWFTLAQGVMTEVYYPDVTTANVHLLQFLIKDQKSYKTWTEQDDAIHTIRVLRPDSLSFQQVNTSKAGDWKITKTYTTDSQRATVLIDVQFESFRKNLALYVYYDPSLSNSGMHDTAGRYASYITAFDGKIASALLFSTSPKGVSLTSEESNGFLGVNDGLTLTRANPGLSIGTGAEKALDGNVVQTAKRIEAGHFTVALSFAETEKAAVDIAIASLNKGFVRARSQYEAGWADYVNRLPKIEAKYQAQFNMAAMQLRAHEDKTHSGANIASLSVPWGGGANANENNIGGYHLVWSRDLYQVATAYMALGDTEAANRALNFVFNVQQKADGSFPQNSFLDGKPFWGSLQMDEVAFPLILAYQLARFDKRTYEDHVKKAADFIVRNGPVTPQERWEEKGGYSPSTIAAEIAGLVCAADIAKKNGDEASAIIWLAAADSWARDVDRWTATTTGKYGDGNYYLRITQNGNPDAGDKIELNNGAGTFDEREIVDGGFLELVRLGIKRADDPLVVKSLTVIDQQIEVQTPNGPGFYRYNHDGYGEMDDGRRWNWDGKYTGKGRLWALLSGERGEYQIALCERATDEHSAGRRLCQLRAIDRLRHLAAFANEGLMIPEQIWDRKETPKNVDKQFIPELKFGEGTGSATPLAWSMAQFIRLATNLKAGRNLETPQVVRDRYRNGVPGQTSNFGGSDSEVILPLKPGETMEFPRDADKGTRAAFQIGNKTYSAETNDKGKLVLKFEVPPDGTVAPGGVLGVDGSTAFERVTVRQKPREQIFSRDLVSKIATASSDPVIDTDGKAVLFYKGPARSVTVAGDINGWNPNREFMTKIGADLWAIRLALGSAGRTEYKIVVDGKWMLDPANPNTLDNGLGDRNSVLERPQYRAAKFDPAEPRLDEFEITSAKYGQRKVKVYLPDGYAASAKRYPVMYFHDGSAYVSRAGAPQIMERLAAARKIPQLILVFLDPVDRAKEYWASDDYAKFVADEVLPEVDRRYRTIADSAHRGTIGASLGGVTALWLGLKYPDKFSRIGGESSSFWIDNGRVIKGLETLDARTQKFRFFLDDGLLEGAEDTRRVNVMLRAKGFPVTYLEQETGHNWSAWRDRLPEALTALWR